jgi:hypothetical protein
MCVRVRVTARDTTYLGDVPPAHAPVCFFENGQTDLCFGVCLHVFAHEQTYGCSGVLSSTDKRKSVLKLLLCDSGQHKDGAHFLICWMQNKEGKQPREYVHCGLRELHMFLHVLRAWHVPACVGLYLGLDVNHHMWASIKS